MKRTMLILAITVMASSVQGAWTYVAYDDPNPAHADFVGSWTPQVPQPTGALPDATKNPNGPWSYQYWNGVAFVPSQPVAGIQWSGWSGWHNPANTNGLYGLFGKGWSWGPGMNFDIGMTGHSSATITFTVPAFEDGGSTGVMITGVMKVAGGAPEARHQEMVVNGQQVVYAVDDWSTNSGSLYLPGNPGDVLRIQILPDGGPGTFVSWDVTMTEVPEPMTMVLLGIGSLIACRKR